MSVQLCLSDSQTDQSPNSSAASAIFVTSQVRAPASHLVSCLLLLKLYHIQYHMMVSQSVRGLQRRTAFNVLYFKMLAAGKIYRCACPYQASCGELEVLLNSLGVQRLVCSYHALQCNPPRSTWEHSIREAHFSWKWKH